MNAEETLGTSSLNTENTKNTLAEGAIRVVRGNSKESIVTDTKAEKRISREREGSAVFMASVLGNQVLFI